MTARLMDVTHTMMDSPLGELTLVGNDGALAGVYFAGQRQNRRGDANLSAHRAIRISAAPGG